jgi:hypothetical protein
MSPFSAGFILTSLSPLVSKKANLKAPYLILNLPDGPILLIAKISGPKRILTSPHFSPPSPVLI